MPELACTFCLSLYRTQIGVSVALDFPSEDTPPRPVASVYFYAGAGYLPVGGGHSSTSGSASIGLIALDSTGAPNPTLLTTLGDGGDEDWPKAVVHRPPFRASVLVSTMGAPARPVTYLPAPAPRQSADEVPAQPVFYGTILTPNVDNDDNDTILDPEHPPTDSDELPYALGVLNPSDDDLISARLNISPFLSHVDQLLAQDPSLRSNSELVVNLRLEGHTRAFWTRDSRVVLDDAAGFATGRRTVTLRLPLNQINDPAYSNHPLIPLVHGGTIGLHLEGLHGFKGGLIGLDGGLVIAGGSPGAPEPAPDQWLLVLDAAADLLPVDLDIIKPGTEKDATPAEIAEEKEDGEGEVVNVNWDDDDNSEGNGGHGKLVFKNDFDDANGTNGEDDLIQLKLHKPAVEGAKARLKYDNSFVKIWLKPDRKDEVKSEDTEIELTEDKIVFLEGRKITEAEKPKEIEMQIKAGGAGAYAAGDKVAMHVATPIMTFYGKHLATRGMGSRNLAEQLHDRKYLGKNRRDDRNNTVILKGRNQQGKVLWYSVDMVDITPSSVGDLERNRPRILVRAPNLDKEMKMALSLAGAHVFYDGHSNFGLGPNFNVGSTKTVDDYMNLSGRGMTAITIRSEDPGEQEWGGNAMKNPDHGGADFALMPTDLVGQITNYAIPFIPTVSKFIGPAVGATLTKQFHADGTPYHYQRQDSITIDDQTISFPNWITIVKSSGDVPVLRYSSCFMASCDTGRHFTETLNHGVLLFSMDVTYGVLGGKVPRLPEDHLTDSYSWGITHYIRLLTEGKSWAEIVTFFNQTQLWNSEYGPKTLSNYKFKTF